MNVYLYCTNTICLQQAIAVSRLLLQTQVGKPKKSKQKLTGRLKAVFTGDKGKDVSLKDFLFGFFFITILSVNEYAVYNCPDSQEWMNDQPAMTLLCTCS